MAKVDYKEGKIVLTVTPEEMLDLRKHALECAVRLYADHGNIQSLLVQDEILALADKFNIHLLRNPGENG